MKPHQHDLFAPRAPERRALRDWLYIDVYERGPMGVSELRERAIAAGYAEEVARGDLERDLSALVEVYLVRRVRNARHLYEVCP